MNVTVVSAILAATLPTLAVLIGILIHRTDTSRLSGEIAILRAEIRTQGDSLSSKIDATRLQLHNDIVMLMNIDREQDSRITRLEPRS